MNDIKVIEIRLLNDGKPLKAFVDIRLMPAGLPDLDN